MAVPDYQTIMLPILEFLGNTPDKDHHIRDVIDYISSRYKLTEEEKQVLLPSGKQPMIDNRVGWARTYMLKAGLVESPKRGFVKITKKGLEILYTKPARIDIEYLEQFPGFNEFRSIKNEQSKEEERVLTDTEKKIESVTPDELIENGFNLIQADLGQKLLDKIRGNTPKFFEKLVLQLLSGMGYGEGEVTGRSGDGGADGFISQDRLGLDKVFFQAKRFGEDTPVSTSMLRDFIGTLDLKGVSKGVFITTSKFPKDAEDIIKNSKSPKLIVLVDGIKLVKFMIEFNIGVSSEKIYEIKTLDSDFFTEELP